MTVSPPPQCEGSFWKSLSEHCQKANILAEHFAGVNSVDNYSPDSREYKIVFELSIINIFNEFIRHTGC